MYGSKRLYLNDRVGRHWGMNKRLRYRNLNVDFIKLSQMSSRGNRVTKKKFSVFEAVQWSSLNLSGYLGIGVVLELLPDKAVEGIPAAVCQIPAYGPDVAEQERLAEHAVQPSRVLRPCTRSYYRAGDIIICH